jgi:hypothetical protein
MLFAKVLLISVCMFKIIIFNFYAPTYVTNSDSFQYFNLV